MRFKIFADPVKMDLKDKSKNIFTQLVGFCKGCKSVLLTIILTIKVKISCYWIGQSINQQIQSLHQPVKRYPASSPPLPLGEDEDIVIVSW